LAARLAGPGMPASALGAAVMAAGCSEAERVERERDEVGNGRKEKAERGRGH